MRESIFEYQCRMSNNEQIKLDQFRGKVLLIVNTASKCGFTPQLKGLENLYRNFKDRGFEILAFPCNQFARQDPDSIGNIKKFCERRLLKQ